MNAKHTPGDWQLGGDRDCVIVHISPEVPSLIAITAVPIGTPAEQRPLEERRANARLIKAAPELLKALKDLHDEVETLCNGEDECDVCQLIAKVEEK